MATKPFQRYPLSTFDSPIERVAAESSTAHSALLTGSYWSLLGLSLITIGLYASNAHLFPLPAVFLTGPALASGIAWVNSVGILGGSVSPPVMGYLRDMTGNFAGGLYALAGFAALAAIVAAVGVRETPARSSAAEPLVAAAG